MVTAPPSGAPSRGEERGAAESRYASSPAPDVALSFPSPLSIGYALPVKRFLRVLTWLAVLAVIVAALMLTVFRSNPVPVSVHRVDRGEVESLVVNSRAGTVKSRQRSQLSPGISGTVVEITARKGDTVAAGQLLLRLDDAEVLAQVNTAAKNLAAAEAAVLELRVQYDQAGRELSRNRPLAEQGAIPASTLESLQSRRDAAEAAMEAARERVKQARAQLESSRTVMEKTRVHAPFTGTVAEISTELGEWLSPSPPGVNIPAVIDLVDLDSLYVSAPLDEIDLAKVREGLPVRVTIDAFPDSEFPGRVRRIAPYVQDRQEQNRTFEVEVGFESLADAHLFRPGATADVEVILERRERVIRIPTYALMEGDKVLLLERGRLVARSVRTGLRNWEYTEILEGLAEGDEIVTSLDRAEVKEGAEAVVSDEPAK